MTHRSDKGLVNDEVVKGNFLSKYEQPERNIGEKVLQREEMGGHEKFGL